MASKNTQITLRVAAVDATARVFKSVAAGAVGVTTEIAKWGAVAVGAAVGAFALAVKELGKLSDVAQAAGASVKDLTQLSGAFDVLGIKGGSVEELASAFQRMTKTTGETGTEGFYKIVEQISQLPTQQERATEAMRVFGRTGLQFLPLVNRAAEHGIESIKGVAEGIPGISDAAANAGDKVADGMSIVAKGAKSIWYEAVGKIAEWFDSKFAGGVRVAAYKAVVYMRHWARVVWRYGKEIFGGLRDMVSNWSKDWSGALVGMGKLLGSFLWTVLKSISGALQAPFERMFHKIAAGVARLMGNTEFADMMDQLAEQSGTAAENFMEPWREFGEEVRKSKLVPDRLLNLKVDTKDLDEELKENLKKAEEAGRLAGLGNGKQVGGEPVQRAAGAERRTNPEAILGGSYKAMTYAMRAGYASVGDKIVAGLKRVGDLMEKVAKNTDNLDDIETPGVVN